MDHGHGREHENFSPSIAYATPKAKRSAPTSTTLHPFSILTSPQSSLPTKIPYRICHLPHRTTRQQSLVSTPCCMQHGARPLRPGPRPSRLHGPRSRSSWPQRTSHQTNRKAPRPTFFRLPTLYRSRRKSDRAFGRDEHTPYTVAKSSLSNRSRNASPHIALIARSAWRVAPPPLCAAPPRAWPPSSP